MNSPNGSSRQLGGFESWEDFRTFMEKNLAGHVKAADEIFKANCASTKFTELSPYFNSSERRSKIAMLSLQKINHLMGLSRWATDICRWFTARPICSTICI